MEDAKRPSGTQLVAGIPARSRRPADIPASHAVATAPQPLTTDTQHSESPQVDHATALPPGTRIRQYELIRELGRGGMGLVYAARDLRLGRRVAIKFLRNATREVADRFLVEARATAQCNHDNIVIIHEVDEHAGIPYMVLEFVEGQSFRELMGPWGEGKRLPASRVVELMLPVARALTRAHELGIVHRDLKPENVLVTGANQVKVLDFGIAKALGDRATEVHGHKHEPIEDLELTHEGSMVGTLPYMAPEQMGVGGIDHRADLWAAGVMMFEMLAGRHPVEPLTSEALFQNLLSDDPMPSVREVVPELSADLAEVVSLCTQKSKAERIATAAELVQRLEALLPDRRGRRLAEGESPYPGLTAFQETDANRFFGRNRDVARMVAKIRELPLTGVVGPSGVGKSSFIRAGIGPALKASGERWEVVTMRPGRQPMAALARLAERATLSSTPQRRARLTDHSEMIKRFRHEPGYLGALLRGQRRARRVHRCAWRYRG